MSRIAVCGQQGQRRRLDVHERARRGVDGRDAIGGQQPVVGGVGPERKQLGEGELWHGLTLRR